MWFNTGSPSFEFVIENRSVRLSIEKTELYKTLYGRKFDLHVKSKYISLNNRNKDHLPQLSLVCVCTQFGAIGGDLGKLWVSEFLLLTARNSEAHNFPKC